MLTSNVDNYVVLKDYQSSQPKSVGQWTNQVQEILLHLKILDPMNSNLQSLFYFFQLCCSVSTSNSVHGGELFCKSRSSWKELQWLCKFLSGRHKSGEGQRGGDYKCIEGPILHDINFLDQWKSFISPSVFISSLFWTNPRHKNNQEQNCWW